VTDPTPLTDTAELAAGEDAGAVPDAPRRGLLVIAPRVIERIAARAASDVDGVAPRGSAPPGKGVQADADLKGPTATLALRVGVAYPRPVGRVAAAIRSHVADRVQELTGVTVAAMRVTVDELKAAATGGRPA
jgi:uncharacterized alkaline shock family protein YloU